VAKSYASDGVVAGLSDVYRSSPQLKCGIVCHHWPSWFYALAHKAFKVAFILVTNPSIYEDVKSTFSSTTVLLFSPNLDALPSVDVLCFNGSGSFLFSTPPMVGVICLFDWKFRFCGGWRNWVFRCKKVSHFQCGGTSSFVGFITVGFHDSCVHCWIPWLGSLVGSFPGCNLSALIKCTVGGTELDSDPCLAGTVPANTVFPLGKNLFHYKGLFPFGSWSAEFITPCVFTKLKLVRRKLSSSELQEVLDIPLVGVRKRSFICLLPHFTVPIKVLSAIISHLFLTNNISGGGG
jgi:hypothetical protein